MHPAFSVIFFTTLSGAGYGLWFWLALWQLGSRAGDGGVSAQVIGLALGLVLVSAGLLSSTLHLGKPLRAWRAFSQWRSSWLSREGVLAVLAYLPVLALLGMLLAHGPLLARLGPPAWVALMLLALATVACTAMIYVSLQTIPAWSHPLVLPVYLGFALQVGGLLAAAMISLQAGVGNLVGLAILLLSFALWRLKKRYWQEIDLRQLPATRTSALGLPADRSVKVFEHPHTEANYLTLEMGFVLARKHSRKLRAMAIVLFAGIPALCALPLWLLPHFAAAPWLCLAALSALLGSMVERWLFFAEARHVLMLYY